MYTSAPESLQGQIDKIIFYNLQNHFLVANFVEENSDKAATVVGTMIDAKPGESFRLSGRWQKNRRFGFQFRFDSYILIAPSTLSGIQRFLDSGLIKGIGPELAKRLVHHFEINVISTKA
jgi:exodeoxyribonuclease V alpha subunit